MDLNKLFTLVLEKSKRERINNAKFNGLKFWRSIKSKINDIDTTVYEWNPIFSEHIVPKEMLDTILRDIPEHNSENKTKTIEINHFFIQIVRIPHTEECNLRKILQLALNIGQFLGTVRHYNGFLYSCMKNMIKQLQLDKLTTFVNESVIHDINLKINQFNQKNFQNNLLKKLK